MCDFNIEFDEEKVFEEKACIEFESKKEIELFESWLDKQGIKYSNSLLEFWDERNRYFEFSKCGFKKRYYINYDWKIYQFKDVFKNGKEFDATFINNFEDVILKMGCKKTMKEKNQIEKYEFRGKFNIDLICNDLFRSMKRSAVIIGKENALVIMSHNYIDEVDEICFEVIYDNNNFKEYKSSDEIDIIYPYFFKIIPKKDANIWIQILRDENKRYNKMILKMKDKNTKLMKQGKNKKDHFRVFMI